MQCKGIQVQPRGSVNLPQMLPQCKGIIQVQMRGSVDLPQMLPQCKGIIQVQMRGSVNLPQMGPQPCFTQEGAPELPAPALVLREAALHRLCILDQRFDLFLAEPWMRLSNICWVAGSIQPPAA